MTRQRWLWFEGGVLLLAFPFLLYSTFSPGATTIILLLLVLCWLGWSMSQSSPITPFNFAMLLLFLMVGIAILITADPDLTQPKATGLILGFALWYYLTRTIFTPVQLAWAGLLFCLVGIGFTLVGVLGANWFNKIPFFYSFINRFPDQLIRLPGASDGVHTNELAGTTLFYLPLLLALVVEKQLVTRLYRSRLIYLFILSCFLLTSGIVLLAQSRSAWLGVLAGLAVLGLSHLLAVSHKQVSFNNFMLGGIGILLIVLINMVNLITRIPTSTVVANLTAVTFRQEVWQWGIAAVHDFPLTGTGLGTFRRVVRRFYPLNVPADYDIAHAHNIFLQTALDIGLPGLVAYLAILGIAGVVGWQAAKRDEALRPFALGLLASLVAFHTYGLTDALALGSKPGILFWMVLGLLSAMSRMKDEE